MAHHANDGNARGWEGAVHFHLYRLLKLSPDVDSVPISGSQALVVFGTPMTSFVVATIATTTTTTTTARPNSACMGIAAAHITVVVVVVVVVVVAVAFVVAVVSLLVLIFVQHVTGIASVLPCTALRLGALALLASQDLRLVPEPQDANATIPIIHAFRVNIHQQSHNGSGLLLLLPHFDCHRVEHPHTFAGGVVQRENCLLYTSPSPRDRG